MKWLAAIAVTSLLSCTTGCMFIEGALRSGDDSRRDGRYASKSYGQHVLDATFERPRPRKRVVVCHCHGHCDHV